MLGNGFYSSGKKHANLDLLTFDLLTLGLINS
jgi:hypothetical protein